MLDIIVTHYNEPWRIGRKFFDMLGCQRGVDFDQFHVYLVHDGTEAFPERFFQRYPYKVDQYTIPHGGVSKARNYGLDHATDTWVQFCDFDDMYTNCYALQGIMKILDRDIDYMWTPFIMETMHNGKLFTKIQEENVVFVHGKYFRRQWLIDNDLRFPEGIHYSEDSAFCAIVNELAKRERRGMIKTGFPAYSWIVRPDSVSMDPKNIERNLLGFIERNFYVVEEFKRRGIPNTLMIGRMFTDAYHAFHRADVKFPDHEAEFSKRARVYLDQLHENSEEDMSRVMYAAGANFSGIKMDYTETFSEWEKRIMGEGNTDV